MEITDAELEKLNVRLFGSLKELIKNGKTLNDNPNLSRIIRKWYEEQGIVNEFNPLNVNEIYNRLLESESVKLSSIIEDLEIKEKIDEAEIKGQKLESRALNQQDLKTLLEELDKHDLEKEIIKAEELIKNNLLLRRVRIEDIQRIIERKIELEKLEKAKLETNKTPIKKEEVLKERFKKIEPKEADKKEVEKIFKKIVEIEDEGGEKNTKREKVNKLLKNSQIEDNDLIKEITFATETILNEKPINKEASERVNTLLIAEAKIQQNVGDKINKESIEKIAEKIKETSFTENSIEENSVKISKIIESEKINDRNTSEEIIKIANDTWSRVDTEEKISQITEEIVLQIKTETNISETKTKQIGELVKERVVAKFDDPETKLNDSTVKIEKSSEKVELEKEDSLVQKIQKIVGIDDNKKTTIEKIIEKGEVMVENTMIKEVEFQGNTQKERSPSERTNKVIAIDRYRAEKVEEKIYDELIEKGVIKEEAKDMAALVRKIQFPEKEESTTLSQYKEKSVLKRNGYPESKIVSEQARIIKNLVRSPIKISENIERINKISEKLEGSKSLGQLGSVAKILSKNPKLVKSLERLQNIVQFQDRISTAIGGISTQIGNILHIEALKDFGIRLATKFGGETVGAMATQIASLGLEGGIKNIIGQLATKGTVTAVKAGAATAAKGAATAGLSAAGVVGGLPTALIMLGFSVIKKAGSLIKKGFEKFSESIGLSSVKTKVWLQDNFGKGFGGFLHWAGTLAGVFLGLPAILGAGSILIVAWVVPAVLGAIIGLNMITATTVSPLVAPKGTTGSCVKITGTSNGGQINCNQNAPENAVAGVDKANFISKANAWKTGKNYSQECYNDTVNRALCAGINPTYALWVWIHESGASNYSTGEVDDFGVSSINKPNDYNEQINAFLKLNPASACINDPRIGGDYWLAFSANFLNGDCDPDKLNPAGVTPRQYKGFIEEQWSWISSAPLPDSIQVTPGGQNCGDIGNSSSSGGDNTYTYVDENGDSWLCENGETDQNISFDPNAPGLTGVVVEGECSVSDKAYETKQCDPEWGSTPLNGGGTICSAGCGPTSVSMMARIKNGQMKPPVIIFSQGSAYSSMGGEGSSLLQAKQELAKMFGSSAVAYDAVTQGCDEKAIAKWICEGKVVMILADYYRNSNLALGGHFVLGVAVNNGKIVTYDPYYPIRTPFDGTQAYGYAHNIRGCLTVEASAIK